ncbi:MAG: hypothetical protein KDD53_04460 [Bdellovibrionales bacterium]|nr:hypothetical protein [Bdellovibrionales bacterium]
MHQTMLGFVVLGLLLATSALTIKIDDAVATEAITPAPLSLPAGYTLDEHILVYVTIDPNLSDWCVETDQMPGVSCHETSSTIRKTFNGFKVYECICYF